MDNVGRVFSIFFLILVMNEYYANCIIETYRYPVQPNDEHGNGDYIVEERAENNRKALRIVKWIFETTKSLIHKPTNKSQYIKDRNFVELWYMHYSIDAEVVKIRVEADRRMNEDYNKMAAATLVPVLIIKFFVYYYVSNVCMGNMLVAAKSVKGPEYVWHLATYLLTFAERIPSDNVIKAIKALTRPYFTIHALDTFHGIGGDLKNIHKILLENLEVLRQRALQGTYFFGTIEKHFAEYNMVSLARKFSEMLFEFPLSDPSLASVQLGRRIVFEKTILSITGEAGSNLLLNSVDNEHWVVNHLQEFEKDIAAEFGFSKEEFDNAPPIVLTLALEERPSVKNPIVSTRVMVFKECAQGTSSVDPVQEEDRSLEIDPAGSSKKQKIN